MSNDNRGLASADEKTRKRVASEGGKAPDDERGQKQRMKRLKKEQPKQVEKHLIVAAENKED